MRSSTLIALSFLGAGTNALPVAQSSSSSSSSGYFPSITEIGWCLIPWHWDDCLAAQGIILTFSSGFYLTHLSVSDHADIASATAAKLYTANSLHNGKGDAFRHCYWNARMAIDLDSDTAKTIADNHEDGSNGPEAEKNMDRANNASGRSVGQKAGGGGKGARYNNAQATCQSMTNTGALVTLE